MTARPDLLGLLPFADVADHDPNALPFGDGPQLDIPCAGCNAEAGEECRPGCIGEALALEEAAP